MLRDAFADVVIEPQRQALIPGFGDVQRAAMDNGAIGCSISGAGPTVFAWCEESSAPAIRDAMVGAFGAHGLLVILLGAHGFFKSAFKCFRINPEAGKVFVAAAF